MDPNFSFKEAESLIKIHIPHLFLSFKRLSRSVWRTCPSICELRARYIAVSSAKSLYSWFDLLWQVIDIDRKRTGPEVIKLFSCSTQLSMKF